MVKFDHIKIKGFCSAEESTNGVSKQMPSREKTTFKTERDYYL